MFTQRTNPCHLFPKFNIDTPSTNLQVNVCSNHIHYVYFSSYKIYEDSALYTCFSSLKLTSNPITHNLLRHNIPWRNLLFFSYVVSPFQKNENKWWKWIKSYFIQNQTVNPVVAICFEVQSWTSYCNVIGSFRCKTI